jgi:transposase-like protein
MLRFGPYHLPRVKIGQRVECEYAGTVRIVAISDAPQQWPLGVVRGHRIPVLYRDLVRAVRTEAAIDVAEAWGVSPGLVSKWRKALRVKSTTGTRQRRSEGVKARDPARAHKIALAHRGQPRDTAKATAARLAKPVSEATRQRMSEAHRRRGTRPPAAGPAWSKAHDRLVLALPPAEVAKRTGRTISAVYSRRWQLGLNDGRTTRHQRTAKP